MNNLLDLTEDENLWLRRAKKGVYLDERYVVSWHLRETIGGKTAQVNYQLNKLVKKGYLRKAAEKTHTKYYLTEKSK